MALLFKKGNTKKKNQLEYQSLCLTNDEIVMFLVCKEYMQITIAIAIIELVLAKEIANRKEKLLPFRNWNDDNECRKQKISFFLLLTNLEEE